MDFHEEKIICPECGMVQVARVEHTVPWYSYIHTCKKCGYTIMECEWLLFNEETGTFDKYPYERAKDKQLRP